MNFTSVKLIDTHTNPGFRGNRVQKVDGVQHTGIIVVREPETYCWQISANKDTGIIHVTVLWDHCTDGFIAVRGLSRGLEHCLLVR